jgi:hypothetical protein
VGILLYTLIQKKELPDKFSVSHCGIQKPQCGIHISHCEIHIPQYETEKCPGDSENINLTSALNKEH